MPGQCLNMKKNRVGEFGSQKKDFHQKSIRLEDQKTEEPGSSFIANLAIMTPSTVPAISDYLRGKEQRKLNQRKNLLPLGRTTGFFFSGQSYLRPQ